MLEHSVSDRCDWHGSCSFLTFRLNVPYSLLCLVHSNIELSNVLLNLRGTFCFHSAYTVIKALLPNSTMYCPEEKSLCWGTVHLIQLLCPQKRRHILLWLLPALIIQVLKSWRSKESKWHEHSQLRNCARLCFTGDLKAAQGKADL